MSGAEILVIALVALILFGNEKLPENMKKMFHGLNKGKKILNDVQKSWHEVKVEVQRNLNFEEEKQQLKQLTQPIVLETAQEKQEVSLLTPTPPKHPGVPSETTEKKEQVKNEDGDSSRLLPPFVGKTPEP